MRYFLTFALALAGASAWGQTPQAPNPSPPKSTPQAQPPPPVQQTQLYQLVPVNPPTQQTVQVQQPQYQTVQLVQAPAPCQTVQLAQPPVQQVQYVPATQTTFGVSQTGSRTVVLGPSIVGLSIARVGQAMSSTFGKSHVWNIQHSIIRPQPQPAPPVQQLVTVSMPQPVVQQPVQVQLLQQPVQQVLQPTYQINAPSEAAPPPPVINPPKPSPQASTVPPPKHHLFGMLGN
jgi:hypothetical protein